MGMGKSYFVWNGTDSRAMGLVLENAPQIMRGEERLARETIPGRSGALNIVEGDRVYNGYIQTVSFHVNGAVSVARIFGWLTGDGDVIFSSEPERQQKARVVGAITVERRSPRMDWWSGQIQFQCEPEKEDPHDSPITMTSGGTLINTGDFVARPLITVACSAGANTTITTNGSVFRVNLTGRTETGFIIDSDAHIVTTLNGQTNLTSLSSGDFPVLAIGSNTIAYSGITSAEWDRRVRYL